MVHQKMPRDRKIWRLFCCSGDSRTSLRDVDCAAEAERLISVLMGDEVGERKKYIFENADFNKEDKFAKIKR